VVLLGFDFGIVVVEVVCVVEELCCVVVELVMLLGIEVLVLVSIGISIYLVDVEIFVLFMYFVDEWMYERKVVWRGWLLVLLVLLWVM